MYKHKLVDFVIHFMEEIDKEISEMKLAVNARARIVAEEFLKNVRFSFWSLNDRFLNPISPASFHHVFSFCSFEERHASSWRVSRWERHCRIKLANQDHREAKERPISPCRTVSHLSQRCFLVPWILINVHWTTKKMPLFSENYKIYIRSRQVL